MYTAKEIGIKISELRKQRKMTQKELAEKLFITSSAVSKWENGDATPDIYRMQKLAEIFHVSIYEFVGTTETIAAEKDCAITDDSVAEVVEKFSENQSSEDKRENSSAPVLQEKGRSRYLKTWVPVGILLVLLLVFVAFFAAGRFDSGRNTEAGAVLNVQGTKEAEQPVMIGTASFDHYVLVLQMCEGTHNSDYNAGPAFGTSWSGKYELVLRDSINDKVASSYLLEEWEEPLSFHESFALNVTDYNSDGIQEVLIGQYGSSNFNFYRMYYITEDLEIGYYEKIGELMITSKEMSPVLEKTENGITYSFYNNGSGETITREIKFEVLTVTEQ